MIQNAQTLIEIIKVFIFKKPCLRLQSFFRWGVGHVDRTTVLPRPSELVSLHGGHTEVTKSSHSWCWNLNFCAVLSTWHQTYNRIYLYFQVKSGSGLEMSIHWQRGRILMFIVFIHKRTFIYLQKSPFDFSNAKKKGIEKASHPKKQQQNQSKCPIICQRCATPPSYGSVAGSVTWPGIQ